jgi:ribonucleotide monophosphatase NagD (HAD superfamily)
VENELTSSACPWSAHTTENASTLIDDTPADIKGAHSHGMRVIAVVTGRSDKPALRDAGAEVVLPALGMPNCWSSSSAMAKARG